MLGCPYGQTSGRTSRMALRTAVRWPILNVEQEERDARFRAGTLPRRAGHAGARHPGARRRWVDPVLARPVAGPRRRDGDAPPAHGRQRGRRPAARGRRGAGVAGPRRGRVGRRLAARRGHPVVDGVGVRPVVRGRPRPHRRPRVEVGGVGRRQRLHGGQRRRVQVRPVRPRVVRRPAHDRPRAEPRRPAVARPGRRQRGAGWHPGQRPVGPVRAGRGPDGGHGDGVDVVRVPVAGLLRIRGRRRRPAARRTRRPPQRSSAKRRPRRKTSSGRADRMAETATQHLKDVAAEREPAARSGAPDASTPEAAIELAATGTTPRRLPIHAASSMVMALQRSAGNAAVRSLLAGRAPTPVQRDDAPARRRRPPAARPRLRRHRRATS